MGCISNTHLIYYEETQCSGGQDLSPGDFTENLPKNLIFEGFGDFVIADKGL